MLCSTPTPLQREFAKPHTYYINTVHEIPALTVPSLPNYLDVQFASSLYLRSWNRLLFSIAAHHWVILYSNALAVANYRSHCTCTHWLVAAWRELECQPSAVSFTYIRCRSLYAQIIAKKQCKELCKPSSLKCVRKSQKKKV